MLGTKCCYCRVRLRDCFSIWLYYYARWNHATSWHEIFYRTLRGFVDELPFTVEVLPCLFCEIWTFGIVCDFWKLHFEMHFMSRDICSITNEMTFQFQRDEIYSILWKRGLIFDRFDKTLNEVKKNISMQNEKISKDFLDITLHSGQIGWQNPFGHPLILKLFSTFWILLDIERSFIRVRAILEQDLHAQMGQ